MDDASCFGKLFSYPPNAMISTKSLTLITTTTKIYLEKHFQKITKLKHFQKITKLFVLLFITKNTWTRKTLLNALYWPKLHPQVDYKRLRQWQHVLENVGRVLKSLGWQKHWRMDSSSYIICVYMWEFLMAALVTKPCWTQPIKLSKVMKKAIPFNINMALFKFLLWNTID